MNPADSPRAKPPNEGLSGLFRCEPGVASVLQAGQKCVLQDHHAGLGLPRKDESELARKRAFHPVSDTRHISHFDHAYSVEEAVGGSTGGVWVAGKTPPHTRKTVYRIDAGAQLRIQGVMCVDRSPSIRHNQSR